MPRVGCTNIAAGPLRGTFSTLGGDTFLRSLVASARDYIFRSSGGHVHCQHLPEAIYSLHLHRLWSPQPTQPNNKSHSLDSRGSLRMYHVPWIFFCPCSACLQLSFPPLFRFHTFITFSSYSRHTFTTYIITTLKFSLQCSISQTCQEIFFGSLDLGIYVFCVSSMPRQLNAHIESQTISGL